MVDDNVTFDANLLYPHAVLEIPQNSVPIHLNDQYLVYSVLENGV